MGFSVVREYSSEIVFNKELENENSISKPGWIPRTCTAPTEEEELNNIAKRCERRKNRPPGIYDAADKYVSMVEREMMLSLARWIRWSHLQEVRNKKVLEIGCGGGKNLLRLILLGFRPENLVGNDLLESSLREARRILPESTRLMLGDAACLNLEDETFDVVFQATVFTSILDDTFRQRLANRMWELVKPGGGILWYDFIYNNPKNPDVRGVPLKRIRQLFPEGEMKFWRLTLAPPIGRLVTKISPRLYSVFNAFPFLRTHVMSWIKKP